MIPEILHVLPKMETPKWLASIKGNPPKKFPLLEIVTNSLFYPACGLNGTPVKFLTGHVLSFIYADYAITIGDYLDNLNGNKNESGFKGYTSILQREIIKDDIVPYDWTPPINPVDNNESLASMQNECKPFGHWSVWKRNQGLDDLHGAELFSFFYMSGEMSAIYQGIYNRLGVSPSILAIIQPGVGGGEWENVTTDNCFFKRVVMANPSGLPRFILYGGQATGQFGHGYDVACWKEYTGKRLIQLPERYAGLWERKA